MTARGAGQLLKRSQSTFEDIGAAPVIDKGLIDQYVEDLLQIDDREGDDEEKVDDPEEEEEDEQVGAKRKTRGGGTAAEGHVKSNTIKRNRPPLVKSLKTMENFTFTELEELFSASSEEIYDARWMAQARMFEDGLQFPADSLPFGVRMHRRAGTD